MPPPFAQLVALLIMLAQLAGVAGAAPWAVDLVQAPDPAHGCTAKSDTDGGCNHGRSHGHSHHPPPQTPTPCSPAVPADLAAGHLGWHEGGPSGHCCECPHALDHRGPQAPGSPRDGSGTQLRPAPVAIAAQSAPMLPPTLARPARARHLEADHPPPVGLKTTRLLI